MSAGQPNQIDAYHLYLGIPTEQQPPTLYRLLGLELCEANPDVIDAAASRQSAYLHQIASGPNRQAVQKLLTEIAGARRYLLDAQRKAIYDAKLQEETNPFGNLAEQLGAIEDVDLTDIPLSELMGEPIAPPAFASDQPKPNLIQQHLGKIVGISIALVLLLIVYSVVKNVLRPTSSDGPEWATGLTLIDGFSEMPGPDLETEVEDPAKIFESREDKLWLVKNEGNQLRSGKWTWIGAGLAPGQTVGIDVFLVDGSDRTQTIALEIERISVRVFREGNRFAVEVSQPRKKWQIAQNRISERAILTVTRGTGPTRDKLTWRLTDEKFDVGADFLAKDLPDDARIAIDVNIGNARSPEGSWIDNLRVGTLGDAPAIKTWAK